MTDQRSTVVRCLDGLEKAGREANVAQVSRIARLDRNLVSRTLSACLSFGLVEFFSRGRSEVFRTTEVATLFRTLVAGDYAPFVNKLRLLQNSVTQMPEILSPSILPLTRAYHNELRNQEQESQATWSEIHSFTQVLSQFYGTAETANSPGMTGGEQSESLNSLLEEVDTLVLALQLAKRNLRDQIPEKRLLGEVEQLLARSDAVIPFIDNNQIRLGMLNLTLRSALAEAINLLRSAQEIKKFASDLGLERPKVEQVGTDGRGRPIFRAK